jgi:uncharacterized membrane protein YqiK
MTAYRDDLLAARERIRALEVELQDRERKDGSQSDRLLARSESVLTNVTVPLILVVLLGFLALRVVALAPLALGAAVLTLFIFSLRGRSVVVRPNEIVVVRDKKSGGQTVWVGPGRVFRPARGTMTESLSLRAKPLSFVIQSLSTADDWFDVDVFAIVALRSDEEGIDRAVRSIDGGAMEQIARAALEEGIRNCVKDTPSAEFKTGAFVKGRFRKTAREVLHDFGIELLQVGFVEVRPLTTSKGSA